MATTASSRYAWQTAEIRCYNYILAVLGVQEDPLRSVRGYLPRVVAEQSELSQWAFRIEGGGDVHFSNPTQRGNVKSWHMAAIFEARTVDRDRALEIAGLLRDAMPCGESNTDEDRLYVDMDGVDRINFSAHPAMSQEIAIIDQDENSEEIGGTIPIYKLSIPLFVVFENRDRIA